jgi:superfamily II DNA/RNA helicase
MSWTNDASARSKPRRAPGQPAGSGLDAALAEAQARPAPQPKSFAELGVPESMCAVLAQREITTPSEIQARTMPDALAGRDVLGRAQTGSGKTFAFGLPMLTRLRAAERPDGKRRPRGLVLVPTRELAQQVATALEPLARVDGLRVTTVYGGAPIGRQIDSLRRGVDVVVATPGRLLDLMERRVADLDAVSVMVVDEADHMADLGFLPAVTRIIDATPASRQCLMFSATLDGGVDRLAQRYLSNPAVHAVTSASAPVTSKQHQVFLLDHDDKVDVAAEIATRPERTLFFVRTKHGADRLAKQLVRRGIDAAAIHGNLNQNQRTRALDAFAAGRVRALIATDVAARGLHIDALDMVVHFDPPSDHKHYLHRSGRTARAGATGTVISLVEAHQARDVARIHAAASVKPDQLSVRAGDPAVRAIATTGELRGGPSRADARSNGADSRPNRAESRSNRAEPRSNRQQPGRPHRTAGRRTGGRNTSQHRAPGNGRRATAGRSAG